MLQSRPVSDIKFFITCSNFLWRRRRYVVIIFQELIPKEEIISYLRLVIYDGGTDFECIKSDANLSMLSEYDRSLVFTNGVSSLGKPLEVLSCPMHIFSKEAEADTRHLGIVARKSGGSYHHLDNVIVTTLVLLIFCSGHEHHFCCITSTLDRLFKSTVLP